MHSLLSNAPNGYELISTLDFFESRTKRKTEKVTSIGAGLAGMIFAFLFSNYGYTPWWGLLAIILLIPTVLLHEMFHYVFQWLFSHRKPRLGFKFPFPYSALAPNALISKNQGIFCATAPLLFITLLLVLPSLFFNAFYKLILLELATIQAVSCFGDFLFINWLLRYPKHVKLGTIGLSNALFQHV